MKNISKPAPKSSNSSSSFHGLGTPIGAGTSRNEKWSFVLIGLGMQLIKETIRGQVRKIMKPQGFVRSMKACDDTMQPLTPHEYQTNHSPGRSKSLAPGQHFPSIWLKEFLKGNFYLGHLFPQMSPLSTSTLSGVCPGWKLSNGDFSWEMLVLIKPTAATVKRNKILI